MFKVKGEGFFDQASYLVIDDKFITYDPKANVYMIDNEVQLTSFGKAWITSEMGERYLSDISYRRSLENNMTFVQNYARKVIFLETSHAKDIEKMMGKGMARRLTYKQYADDALVRDSESTAEDET